MGELTCTHVVMFSGGINSWAAAKRVAARYGTARLTLLFADTGIEDEDLYRFLDEAAANVGGTLVKIAEGRTPWQVFFAERYLGNSLIDPCSKILKRQMLDSWLKEHCDPADTMIAHGFDWSEGHRMARMLAYHDGWQRWAPLLTPPYLTKADMLTLAERQGLRPPKLYALGFPHCNCGGTCVKAGQSSWALVLRELPERFLEWEKNEQALREFLGKDVSILKDRTGGMKTPLTLKMFRERIERGIQPDLSDWGTCGCFHVAEPESRSDEDHPGI